jgi:hypothetical protein
MQQQQQQQQQQRASVIQTVHMSQAQTREYESNCRLAGTCVYHHYSSHSPSLRMFSFALC